ncbi:MAG TPA: DUF2807 domain-containing protein [Allosphingosinicella sp.]
MPVFLALCAAAPALAAERSYSVTDFDRVQVDGPYEVRLVTGRSSSAKASGSQQALDRVSVEVQGRTLRVRENRAAWGNSREAAGSPVTVELSTRLVRGATVTGPGSLSVLGAQGLKVDLALSGSGTLDVTGVAADDLTVGLLGSGRITVAGKAKQMRATVRGSGDLDAGALATEDTLLGAASNGTVVVAAKRTARVTASGQGKVEVIGTPSCILSGPTAARVKCGK